MLLSDSLRTLAVVGLLAPCVLLSRDLSAAPNYYSQGSTTKIPQRIVVSLPSGGQFEAGSSLTVAWQKTTPDPKIDVWLYTATSDGLRGDKVRYIAPPVGASFKPDGGKFEWAVPENLPRGRYIVLVESGLDQATSAPFMIADAAAKLTAVREAPSGIVKSATVESKGTKGSVKLQVGDKVVEYQWGYGQCPSLVGGLPGALTTIAAIGNVTIVPSIRDVVKKEKIEQTCLDGYTVNSPNPVASAAAASER
jgi:hypothetical protein